MNGRGGPWGLKGASGASGDATPTRATRAPLSCAPTPPQHTHTLSCAPTPPQHTHTPHTTPQIFHAKQSARPKDRWVSGNAIYFRMNHILDIYFVGGFGTVQVGGERWVGGGGGGGWAGAAQTRGGFGGEGGARERVCPA